MKNNNLRSYSHVLKAVFVASLACAFLTGSPGTADAKSAPIGDIVLKGSVERGGLKLTNDTNLFEGDTLRTLAASGGIVRVSGGRVEIGESTEVSIERAKPLRISVKSGTIAFSFPEGTQLEVITPQLEVRPNSPSEKSSGRVTAQPQKRDSIESRSGGFTVRERETGGQTTRIQKGQVLMASLTPAAPPVIAAAPDAPDSALGPIGSAQIALLAAVSNFVQVARSAAPTNLVRVKNPGLSLANGDWVKTTNGLAEIRFTDGSELSLNPGTNVRITEQPVTGGFLRTIEQRLGSLWFNIQKGTKTTTKLQTPTAVAAIRGTQGTQVVPNDFQSTHTLNEGIEDITENETGQTITLRAGQSVTAVRGIGFTPIINLLASIPKPIIGTVGSAANRAAAAGASGDAGGAIPGAAARASTISTVAIATGVGVLGVAVLGPLTGDDLPRVSESEPSNAPN